MVRHYHTPGRFPLHTMMTFFGIFGRFIKGSRFEEIIFELGLYTSGSIKSMIPEKQYNRCWSIHESFSKALWRLCMASYVYQTVPEILQATGQDLKLIFLVMKMLAIFFLDKSRTQ